MEAVSTVIKGSLKKLSVDHLEGDWICGGEEPQRQSLESVLLEEPSAPFLPPESTLLRLLTPPQKMPRRRARVTQPGGPAAQQRPPGAHRPAPPPALWRPSPPIVPSPPLLAKCSMVPGAGAGEGTRRWGRYHTRTLESKGGPQAEIGDPGKNRECPGWGWPPLQGQSSCRS